MCPLPDRDHPVRPVVLVVVEVQGAPRRRVLLRCLQKRHLPARLEDTGAVPGADGLDDGLGVDALVDVE